MITSLVTRAEIAQILLSWPVFQQDNVRRDLIAPLPFHTSIATGQNAEEHVFGIVNACCAQPRGFAALFDEVRLQTPEQSFDAIFTILERETHVPVKWRERISLKRILRSARPDPELLWQAWRRATGKDQLPADPNRLLHYLDFLAEERALPTDAPLFFFLEYLRPHLGNEEALEQWEDEVAQRLKTIDLPAIRDRAKFARQSGPRGAAPVLAASNGTALAGRSPVLMLRVQPTHLPGQYCVHGWLYRDADCQPLEPAREEDDEAEKPGAADDRTPEAGLDRKAARFIQSALDLLHGSTALRIEVILPIDLLDHPIDEWKIPITDTDSDAIGVQWPVMLRSWERIAKLDYRVARNIWSAKWPRLQAEWKHAQSRRWWLPGVEDPAGMRAQMQEKTLVFFAARLSGENVKAARAAILKAVVGAGVPIALWLRDYQGEACQREAELHGLLDTESHDVFPEQILSRRKSLRQTAAGSADRFALLWDCPDRIPVQYKTNSAGGVRRLQPPTDSSS